ncbi:hypothetical protein D3C85_1784110 [compost metagenome]
MLNWLTNIVDLALPPFVLTAFVEEHQIEFVNDDDGGAGTEYQTCTIEQSHG